MMDFSYIAESSCFAKASMLPLKKTDQAAMEALTVIQLSANVFSLVHHPLCKQGYDFDQ